MFASMYADPHSFPSLQCAVFHPSCKDARPEHRREFQRLEFLGDAVLDLIVTEMLMRAFPEENEGGLTARRARLVDEKCLAAWAKQINLPSKIINTASGITDRVLADSVEAALGAVYRDAGLDYVRELVQSEILQNAFKEELLLVSPNVDVSGDWNAKGDLQSMVHRLLDPKCKVEYELLAENGPTHLKQFICCARVNGEVLGTGEATTKKNAEKVAAKKALDVFMLRYKADGEVNPKKRKITTPATITTPAEVDLLEQSEKQLLPCKVPRLLHLDLISFEEEEQQSVMETKPVIVIEPKPAPTPKPATAKKSKSPAAAAEAKPVAATQKVDKVVRLVLRSKAGKQAAATTQEEQEPKRA